MNRAAGRPLIPVADDLSDVVQQRTFRDRRPMFAYKVDVRA
jgi:hypothetical protein